MLGQSDLDRLWLHKDTRVHHLNKDPNLREMYLECELRDLATAKWGLNETDFAAVRATYAAEVKNTNIFLFF